MPYAARYPAMPLTPSAPRAQSRADVRRVRDYVLRAADTGEIVPGGQLPTERELAERFQVSRNAVRRALAGLEAEGTLTRQVGRGTFLAGGAPPATARAVSPAEVMDARLKLEPAIAELIVTHATTTDFERMETCLERAERAGTLDDFELWDAALHEALAAATHNRFVEGIMAMVTTVRRQAEWGKLKDRIVTPERRVKYQLEHRAIVDALKTRDAERAKAAILAHLQHARDNLFGF